MEIAALINTHGNPEVTIDTIESVKAYATDKIVLLVDGAAWDQYESLPGIQVPMLKGFYHNYYKAPYRNVALGLMLMVKHYPAADWYCYLEYDCLIGSSVFKKDLLQAEKDNIWCLGADYRDKQKVSLPLIEAMLKTKFEESFYLLGAVMFLHKKFIQKAIELDFFSRFLTYTNEFKNGFMPGYTAWDATEHMLPTLAKHWGGGVGQLSKWSQKVGMWSGNYRRYPIRWQPGLTEEDECVQASIMHPVKDMDHPIRAYHRKKRTRYAQRASR